MKKWVIAVLLMLLVVPFTVRAAEQNLVTAQMLADTTAIEPGKPFTIGLRLPDTLTGSLLFEARIDAMAVVGVSI